MIHAPLYLRKILRPALVGLPFFAILACDSVQPLAVQDPQFSADSTTYSASAGQLYNVHYIVITAGDSSLTTGQQTQALGVPRTVEGTAVPEAPITWAVSPADVATISETGVITGGSTSGTATVTATADGVTRSLTISVTATQASTPSRPVHMISISANAATIKVGEVTQVSGVVRDETGQEIANVPITWSSSPTDVATTETLNSTSGSITGRGVGTATIFAKADSVTRSITISVIDSGSTTAPASTPPTTMSSPTALAAQPRATVNTSYPSVSRQVRVPAGANLQAALDAAQPGDELLLAPGATFVGNFVLPNKGSSTNWIVVRTDVSDASLGGAGTRMTPSRASNIQLAKILTPTYVSAVATAPGAHHWRLTGLEIGGTSSAQQITVVSFGTSESWEPTVASLAHDLIVDRSYLHGTPTQAVHRCLLLSSGSSAIIDSWLSDCHSNEGDSQAILAMGGSGPYVIDNNELSGGHEVVMFGGADPVISNLVATDIRITRNHITRSPSDRGVWGVKNLLELKSAKRVLIQGNVMEHNWADEQSGFAVLIKSANQDGGCPLCGSEDVTMDGNIVKNTGSGLNIAGDVQGPSLIASRITLTDNLIDSLNVGPYSAQGIPLQLLAQATDVMISHNTFTRGTGNTVMLDGTPMVRLSIIATVFAESGYGFRGSGSSTGTNALDMFAPGYTFTSNVNVGATCAWYPATTICPSSWPSQMPQAPDGKPIGADLNRLASLTRGVVVAP